MIVIVMGMSKSGTTLIAKTLHESGIDMSPARTGNYSQSKYEDPTIIEILLEMFSIDRLKSLYIPEKILLNNKIKTQIKKYIKSNNNLKKHWGFKQPWITLCYPEFKKFLPINHLAIGVRRSYKGLLSHWRKRGKKVNEQRVFIVQQTYNALLESYNIPIIDFENILKNGPVELDKITNNYFKKHGIVLKDVRE